LVPLTQPIRENTFTAQTFLWENASKIVKDQAGASCAIIVTQVGEEVWEPILNNQLSPVDSTG